ncbi:hypothetical protein GGR53DRAFT_20930 [Hypoxylon sp. FL1150]|nr:hypothetical protein GGR53DRAFT_20930 [Hypoxylon sp. FL1150]
MPPKRSASGASASTSNKRSKTSTEDEEPPRRARWSAVSGSANADADYRTTWKNPDKWYSYVTICSPIRGRPDDDDDDDDDDDGDEDEEEEEEEEEEGCGKKHCVCLKPVAENPEHPWLVSQAGYRKYSTQRIHIDLRDPDGFEMYTFNDHAAYGCIEVIQNLFLDYDEDAHRGWREQWAICEGLGLFLFSPMSGIMTMVDDGELAEQTLRLAGRMFLNMLAQLDSQHLVGDATEVKNLGTMMAIYMKLPSDMHPYGLLEHSGKKTKKFAPECFDDAILSYANQRGVTLQGPDDIDELTAKLDGDVELPKKGAKDPWGWKAALTKYKKKYDGLMSFMAKKKGSGIGGDALDVTTWTSAERKAASYDKKDPLGKREIDAIKKGMVIQRG